MVYNHISILYNKIEKNAKFKLKIKYFLQNIYTNVCEL